MRFRHKGNPITSREYPGGIGAVNKTYVVNQGAEPPEGRHPSMRQGYKEIRFFANSIVEIDDPETIEFLRRQPDVICLDDEEAKKPKMYTEAELEAEIQRRLAAVESQVEVSPVTTGTAVLDIPEELVGFSCDVCGRKFKTEYGVFVHKRSHSPDFKSRGKKKDYIKVT